MASLWNEDRRALTRLLGGTREIPVHDSGEERALAWKARRDRDARDRLVRANLGLVGKIALTYRGMGLPVEDLFHEGVVGLLEAARRFEVARGTRFSTYAVWWIRKRILAALRESSAPLHVPSYRRRQVRRIREVEHSLRNELGRDPDRDEISARMETSVARIDGALVHFPTRLDLDDPAPEGASLRMADRLADAQGVPPDRALIDRESRRSLSEALGRLTARQRQVLAYRYGFDEPESMTLREIGAKLGISRERVRQIERDALEILRRICEKRGAPPPLGRRSAPS